MSTITAPINLRAEDVLRLPVHVNVNGVTVFFLRNKIALRILWAAALLAEFVGKNLDIKINA